MTGSTIPDAIDQLVQLATRVCPAGTEISDGEPPSDSLATSVCLAYASEGEAVEIRDARADAHGAQDAENYVVHNEISVWDGDLDTGSARRQTFALRDAIYAALAEDPSLGDVVDNARPGGGGVMTATEEGSVAVLRFEITVRAWRTP